MSERMKPTFEMSIDTRLLHDRLKAANVGDVVGYEEMDRILGRDVRGDAYGSLHSARRRLQKNDQIVFGTVHKVGLKRLNDVEIVASAEAEIDGLRRRARRAGERVTCVQNFAGMPAESQIKHNASLSLFGAVSAITNSKRVKRLEERVKAARAALPLAKTLAFFAGDKAA